MLIIGCDFHTCYQQIAMAEETTGELLVERRLDHESGEAQAFYRSLPGMVRVGMAFVLTIGTVTRFCCSRKLASYLGLNPTEESSGGRRRLGGISKQDNTMVRWLLIEMVHHAVRQDPELRQDYQRLKFRRGHAVAKVAVARKLAVRLYWMLRSGADYAQLVRRQGSPGAP